jgi:RHS repeat-associated protein
MNRIARYLDPQADDVVSYSYDADGNGVPSGSTPDVFAFGGRNFDPEVPLQFNMLRHFDPTVGQWMSEDPIGHAGDDENLRRYVGE